MPGVRWAKKNNFFFISLFLSVYVAKGHYLTLEACDYWL